MRQIKMATQLPPSFPPLHISCIIIPVAIPPRRHPPDRNNRGLQYGLRKIKICL